MDSRPPIRQSARRPRNRAGRRGTKRAAGVRTRTVWRLLAAIAIVGIAVLVVLGWLWRDGRLIGVTGRPPQKGALARYIGLLPTGDRARLIAPRGLSFSNGRLYVAEPDASRVTVFSQSGRLVRRVTIEATGTCYPVDVAAVNDSIFVVDTSARRVLEVPAGESKGRPVAGSLSRPTAVTSLDGKLLIADASKGFWLFDPSSDTLEPAGIEVRKPGFLGGIAVTDSAFYFSQTTASRVIMAPRTGVGPSVVGDRVNLPRGLAVDAAGRIWVADVLGGQVMVFGSDESLIGNLENEPVTEGAPAAITTPEGVALSDDGSRLYVSESRSGRVLVYALAP